jgi:hypothetical protein
MALATSAPHCGSLAALELVVTNDVSVLHDADTHLDALLPATYPEIQRLTRAPVDAIVTSPWFATLDIALPFNGAGSQCGDLRACAWPLPYLSSGLLPRYLYLRELQRQGRLLVLFGLPRGVLAGVVPGWWYSAVQECCRQAGHACAWLP